MTKASNFSVAILINRTTPGPSCWENALAFVQTAQVAPDTSVLGVFVTGNAVSDVLNSTLEAAHQHSIRQLLATGVPVLLCSSRLADHKHKSLPPGVQAGSLGQWMEWTEMAGRVVEWT